jgi:RimJ/RimL family protein N-acetyltransferase
MELRILTEADIVIYRAIRLRMSREEPEAFGSSYEEFLARPLELVAARIRPVGAEPESYTLGAFDGGQLIGTMGFMREDGLKTRHKAMIWGVYVAPEARGRGISTALLLYVLAHARTLPGLEQVHLTVTLTNEVARRLYLAHGFEAYGREPHAHKLGTRYLDEDLMVLPLRL